MLFGLAALAAAVAVQTVAMAPVREERRARVVDSAATLRGARAAQADFERARRWHLPQVYGGSGGRCDVRIGRFCYWHDDGDYDGPEEPPRIAKERGRLLSRLSAAAERLPGDDWIAGQRVRYLVEHGRATDAIAAAHECRASPWWCSALAGFAFHAAGDFAASARAFDSALVLMPAEQRCRWSDISLLLEGDARKRYERLPCADRDAFERSFWALSRPLFLQPANDVRTEHYARVVMALIQQRARSTHAMAWGDDMRELLIRYGWPTRWSRAANGSASLTAEAHVIGHEPNPSWDFLPSVRALANPMSAGSDDWDLSDKTAQSRYAPSYLKGLSSLEHQFAFFRRGDSATFVAAFDARRDTLFSRDSIDAALAILPDSLDSARVDARSGAARTGVLMTGAPWGGVLASVEIIDREAKAAARARRAVRPPDETAGSVSLSDLLLFDLTDSLPSSLESAARTARGSLRLAANVPIGVYWEVYGLTQSDESLSYSLTVVREGEGWYRRAAQRLRIIERRAPVRMAWTDRPSNDATAATRALSVDLASLARGRYRLELAAQIEGTTIARASRVIEVTTGE